MSVGNQCLVMSHDAPCLRSDGVGRSVSITFVMLGYSFQRDNQNH
jgi:hypothetical protein